MKKLFLFIFILTLVVFNINAQVETRFSTEKSIIETVKVIKNNKNAKITREFTSFDVQKLIEEDKTNEELNIPFRFGKGIDTDITLSDSEWTNIENGRLWSMEFKSKGAYSINFVFNHFYLPEGAELYIANNEGTMLYGPVTSKQNTKNGFFLTDLVQGDNVTVYLFEPSDKQGQTKLTIKRVVHAYRNMFPDKDYGDLGASGNCNNNIACFPTWDLESDAVALVLLANGTEWCSGSLLMTSNQNFLPYFLSAFHCIDYPQIDGILSANEISNAENWLFKFQYKMTTCTGSTATTGITFNGAEFRAAWNNTDFALMEMDNSPVGDTRFSWLGWDRSGNTPTSGAGIHHPSGDVMKISFDDNQLLETNYSSNTGNSHWRAEWDNGVTEGGSSGSPLFDQNKRVIGQLHGGYAACNSSDLRDWYGCFYRSWLGGGTDATRLSNWLDPTNVGVMTMNTSRYPSISGPTQTCENSTITFSVVNPPVGFTWVCSGSLSLVSSSGNSATFYAGSTTGTASVSVKVGDVIVASKTITIGNASISISGPDFILSGSNGQYAPEAPCLLAGPYTWSLINSNDVLDIQTITTGRPMVSVVSKSGGVQSSLAAYSLVASIGGLEHRKHINGAYGQKFVLYRNEPIIQPDFSIYPNPATDLLTVELTTGETVENTILLSRTTNTTATPYTIQLWNETRGLVRTVEGTERVQQVSLQGLPKGMYFVHLIVGEQTVQRKILFVN